MAFQLLLLIRWLQGKERGPRVVVAVAPRDNNAVIILPQHQSPINSQNIQHNVESVCPDTAKRWRQKIRDVWYEQLFKDSSIGARRTTRRCESLHTFNSTFLAKKVITLRLAHTPLDAQSLQLLPNVRSLFFVCKNLANSICLRLSFSCRSLDLSMSLR